jgi:hypothetical protein
VALEALYQHFGWVMSEGFAIRLAEATQGQRCFRSKHVYSLEEFGLSRAWIQQHLGYVMDFYDLPR